MATPSGTRRDDGFGGLLAGLFFLAAGWGLLSLTLVPEWRANHLYAEGRCVLLAKRLAEHPRDVGSYRAEFLIRYTVAGRELQGWTSDAARDHTGFRWTSEHLLGRFTVGEAYPCWYDPADVTRVVLVRGYSWWTCGLLLALVVLSLLAGRAVFGRLRAARCAAGAAGGVRSRQPSGDFLVARRVSSGIPVGVVPPPGERPGARAPVIGRAGKAMTGGGPVRSPVVGTRAPPAPRQQEVRRPDHFSVRDDGTRLRIRFCWVWRRFKGVALMGLAWNGFVVPWYWHALRDDSPFRWLAMLICLPHAAVGLLLVYGALAGLLNRTVIQVTSESLTVWNGPVPWWGNRRLPVAGLERLSCHKDATGVQRGWVHVYGVHARTPGAGEVDLVTELDGAEALFIKQELERWLHRAGRGAGPGSPVR